MSRRTLLNMGWRYLLRHPWQSVLMILGITLGVAVAVAVDLANASASRAFDLSTETVAGKATHQISAYPNGLDEALYVRLRKQGLGVPLAPLVLDYAASPQLGELPLQLMGVDPFADAPFRNYLGGTGPVAARPAVGDLLAFLTQPGAILLSNDLAQRYGLSLGQQIDLEVAGRVQRVTLVGLLQPADNLSRRALDSLVLADIATAQELTGRLGRLDRIDLILPESGVPGTVPAELLERLRALLPEEVLLQPVAARSGAVEQMTAAFRINLTALSLLALVVGLFLIYNTITFSVVQRRSLFGTLRCLGVTRREIFALVLSEALVVGILGALLGSLLGIVMGQGAVRLVTQTINDLFFVVSVRGVQIPLGSLIKGALLGILATSLTAAPPAWEAASVPPRAALSRSGLESKARRAIALAAVVGLALILLGLITLILPGRSLIISFLGTFELVVGFAMLVPVTTGLLMRLASPTFGRFWGTLGRMAPRNVASSLSRTSIAVMALMVAVSVAIGVSLMVGSFRRTVITWLEETLAGDIYISAPGLTSTTPSTPISAQALDLVRGWPGVARVDVLRSVTVASTQGEVHVAATDNYSVGQERLYIATDVSPDAIWERMLAGAVLVSEPFANRLGLPRHGGSVALYTEQGLQSFQVAGVYYDYASTQGTVLMALPVYRRLWDDDEITAIALRLQPGAQVDQVSSNLQTALAPLQRLLVRPNQALRQEVLVVFDRTFAITSALQLLATVVAFIGVLSALLSLELERQRELGILRSLGMTVRQVWALILLETGLMGGVAGLLAMPTGYTLALILVYIINRRSFGWTLQMQVLPDPFIQALLVAVLAALLAGLYPAWRMGKMLASEALRSE
ncbi:MAG: ABC transporter permease [Chloroflexota bacterium]